jgi:hypothetical protein
MRRRSNCFRSDSGVVCLCHVLSWSEHQAGTTNPWPKENHGAVDMLLAVISSLINTMAELTRGFSDETLY